MWRSLFLALGAYTCLLGVEALAIDKAILKPPVDGQPPLIASGEVIPPEWAPWSLMASGAVVVLYSITIPRRAWG